MIQRGMVPIVKNEKHGVRKAQIALTRGLEAIAREVTRTLCMDRLDNSIGASVEREIAMILEHMERLREFHRNQLASVLLVETYVDTELLQMEQRLPRYSWYRFPEREKLQGRLQELGKERRKLLSAYEEKLEVLEDRLLSFLHRHVHLRRENGN